MEFIAPSKQAKAELIIKKSRFIGHVFPAFSEEEAINHIESVKQQHPDATHNVYAYSVGVGSFAEKASDDGEPRGNRGVPCVRGNQEEKPPKRGVCGNPVLRGD